MKVSKKFDIYIFIAVRVNVYNVLGGGGCQRKWNTTNKFFIWMKMTKIQFKFKVKIYIIS